MKFFHLSDLHIGLKLYNRDLGEDQAYILRQIIRLAAEERPDALVIAGDIYDRAVPPAEAVELFDRLRRIGFKSCFLSNNQRERVASFNEKIGEHFIENAHKPAVRNYERAMELLGTDRTNTIFIGDQLFTDIYGARRTGIHSILVKPIHPKEEIQIVFKRYLERIVLYFYKKEEGTL